VPIIHLVEWGGGRGGGEKEKEERRKRGKEREKERQRERERKTDGERRSVLVHGLMCKVGAHTDTVARANRKTRRDQK
jgi:hypothetical protein